VVKGEPCPACGRGFFAIDLPVLTQAKDARLAWEKAAREKAAAHAAEQARLQAEQAAKRARIEAEKAAKLAKEKAERAEKAKAKLKKTWKVLGILAAVVTVCVGVLLLITKVIIPNSRYNKALELLDAGQYEEAIEAFEALDGYKDSRDKIMEAQAAQIEAKNAAAYEQAEALFAAEDYDGAIAAFEALDGYSDSRDKILEVQTAQIDAENRAIYEQAEAMLAAGDYDGAEEAFSSLGEYSDARQMVLNTQEARRNSRYQSAVEFLSKKEYEDAYNIFVELGEYSDSVDQALNAAVLLAEEYESRGEIDSAVEWYKKGGELDEAYKVEYEYITSHYDNNDELTYRYLTELINLGYSDTQALYDKLYVVSFSAYINYSPSKSTANQQNITRIPYSQGCPYFYYCFSGGYPGQTVNVDFFEEASLGDHNVVTRKWYYADHHYKEVAVGEWHSFSFNNRGTNVYEHRITVYDTDSGETLGVYTVSTPFDHF
jgi:tetratricopeptide (TPR) repeat protein